MNAKFTHLNPKIIWMADDTYKFTQDDSQIFGMWFDGEFIYPYDFLTDLGSGPDKDDFLPAYLIHDWLYSCPRIDGCDKSRAWCDAALYYGILALPDDRRFRAIIIWFFVRCFGSIAWNRKRKMEKLFTS